MGCIINIELGMIRRHEKKEDIVDKTGPGNRGV